jgi:hypothetical protein
MRILIQSLIASMSSRIYILRSSRWIFISYFINIFLNSTWNFALSLLIILSIDILIHLHLILLILCIILLNNILVRILSMNISCTINEWILRTLRNFLCNIRLLASILTYIRLFIIVICKALWIFNYSIWWDLLWAHWSIYRIILLNLLFNLLTIVCTLTASSG